MGNQRAENLDLNRKDADIRGCSEDWRLSHANLGAQTTLHAKYSMLEDLAGLYRDDLLKSSQGVAKESLLDVLRTVRRSSGPTRAELTKCHQAERAD